jgi:hypothetical protein
MSAFTNDEKLKIIAIMLQYEPYKGEKITKKLVKEISNKLDKTLDKIYKIRGDDEDVQSEEIVDVGPWIV